MGSTSHVPISNDSIEFPFWSAFSHLGLLELKVLIRRRRPSGFPPLLPRQKHFCGFLIERPISGNCFRYVEGVHTSEVVQHRLLCPPQFSPTLSSIFGCPTGTFQAWRFDGPPPRQSHAIRCSFLLWSPSPTSLHHPFPVHRHEYRGRCVGPHWQRPLCVGWKQTYGLTAHRRGVAYCDVVDRRAGRGNGIRTVSAHDLTFVVLSLAKDQALMFFRPSLRR